MILMGTGSHSLRTQANRYEIRERTTKYIAELSLAHDEELLLISGMAEGWDEMIAWIAIDLGIPFLAYVPTPTYGDYYWRDHSVTGKNRIRFYHQLLAAADHVVYVCDTHVGHSLHPNFQRNQLMVDHCTEALVYNPASRGTRDAVQRLQVAGKPMHIYPFSS